MFEIIIVIGLVLSVFIIGDFLRENLVDVLWMSSDDSIHISVANSVATDHDFNIDFQGYNVWRGYLKHIADKFAETMIAIPTIEHEQSGKGPMYYLTLGSFYYLTDTQPGSFYENGSILSNIIASAFIVLFFFLIKREFGIKIALFSSVLVLLLPYFAWQGTRINPMMLFTTFSIAAFFFLEKKKSHYLMFGIFAGLAHLTHPFGIFLAISYPIYLLINREFKGSLISFGVWVAVLMPWFVKSYYSFQNIGVGLYIPFSGYLSQLFSFLPVEKTNEIYNDFFVTSRVTGTELQLFATLSGALENFAWLYDTHWFVMFILIATGFAFFKIETLRQNIKYVIPTTLFLVLTYYLAFTYVTNIFVQLIFIFIIPIILVFTLWKFKKDFYDLQQSRFSSFVMLFATVTFIGYFYTAIFYQREVPETRQLMILLFLLVPHAILGIEKILQFFKSQVNLPKANLVVTIMLILITLPFAVQSVYGIENINNFWEDNLRPFRSDNSEYKELNKWFLENIDFTMETKIGSNIASRTFLDTGLKTIQLPYPWQPGMTLPERIMFLDFYNISYLIFYNIPLWDYDSMINSINPDSSGYDYEIIYNNTNSYVIELLDYRHVDMSEPELYLKKANYHTAHEQFSESNEIHTEFLNFKPENSDQAHHFCAQFYALKSFDHIVSFCTDEQVSALYPNDVRAIDSRFYLTESYDRMNFVDNAIKSTKILSKMIDEVELDDLTLNNLLHIATLIKKYDDPTKANDLFEYAVVSSSNPFEIKKTICELFVEIDYFSDGIEYCQDILNTNPNELVALYNLGLAYENTDQQDETFKILETYDILLDANPKSQNILISKGNLLNELIKINPIYENIINDKLLQADYFIDNNMIDEAINTYTELSYVEKYKLESYINIKNLYVTNFYYEDALEQFDIIIPMIENYMKTKSYSGSNSYFVTQEYLHTLLYQQADIHLDFGQDSNAITNYIKILDYNKFTSLPYEKLGSVYESQGKSRLAIHQFELALQFDSENQFLIDKLESMKNP